MIGLWDSLRHYGIRHGVDPVIFAGLYLTRLPFLLISLAAVSRRARARRPVLPAAIVFLLLGIFPYVYILVFGRDLPLWLPIAAAALAVITAVQGVRRIRARSRTGVRL